MITYGWINAAGSELQGLTLEAAEREVALMERKGYIVHLTRFVNGDIDERWDA